MIKKHLLLVFMLSTILSNAQNTNVFIHKGDNWRYLDDGSDRGTAWREVNFDDNNWSLGPAELGYGDGDEKTVVSYGGNNNKKYITTYFRKSFQVDDPSAYKKILMEAIRDDGMAVYLNGEKLWTDNMRDSYDYKTYAASTISGAAERNWISKVVDHPLAKGKNVIAVEIHQRSRSSSDISFDFRLTAYDKLPVRVLRQPYIQKAGPHTAVIKWRTNTEVRSTLRYGTDLHALRDSIEESKTVTDHELELTSLSPDTKYFFEVKNEDGVYIPSEEEMYVHSSPEAGSRPFVRAWILGDAGTGDNNQKQVRDRYYEYVSGASEHPGQTDLLLFLGDNAYSSGTDQQYQSNLFDIYEKMLKKTPAWSTMGNHDERSANSFKQSGPYYDIFSFPKRGEIGGVASGTEAYYSFDYANIHFIVLESVVLFVDQAQVDWLKADIQSTGQDWIVAMFHHPAYTKGSHNSDIEPNLIAMRTKFLPILEQNGVDLVLSGHSHSYERSFFINGHYGFSNSFRKSKHIVGKNGAGSGNPDTPDGAYQKPANDPKGAVYITSGSAGKISNAPLDHPAMYTSLLDLGSCVMEIKNTGEGKQNLTVKFINNSGQVSDLFTIQKEGLPTSDRVVERGDIYLFPNPATVGSKVTLRSPVAISSLTLYNITGEAVLRSKGRRFIVPSIPSGEYMLEITTQKGKEYHSFIVK